MSEDLEARVARLERRLERTRGRLYATRDIVDVLLKATLRGQPPEYWQNLRDRAGGEASDGARGRPNPDHAEAYLETFLEFLTHQPESPDEEK